MNLRALIVALHAALLAILLAVSPAGSGSMTLLGVGKVAGAGGACTEATTFLARTSGLSGTETTTVTNLICGLVTDGVWDSLDFIYWFPTNTTTTAALNLKSTSFTLSTTGSCTFTADSGWAGDASTCAGNTGYTPSTSGQITQNNISLGAYITVGPDGGVPIGAVDTGGGNADYLNPGTGGHGNAGLNDGNFVSLGTATVVGDWVLTRNGPNAATQIIAELNGSPLAGSPFSSASGATAINQAMLIWALRGAVSNVSFTADKLISAWMGGTMSSAQRTAIHARLNTACVAMSITGC